MPRGILSRMLMSTRRRRRSCEGEEGKEAGSEVGEGFVVAEMEGAL